MQAIRYSIPRMQSNLQNFFCTKSSCFDYESAVEALNGLQSNADYLRKIRSDAILHAKVYSNTIMKVQKYLERSGITLDELDKLSVIHIAGTKGKGSTSAYCESILRHHGFRTGFYSSPHLFEVRERIRINGEPLAKDAFASHFWDLYGTLHTQKDDISDMPGYFRFLTILALKVFLAEKVDVAVIEVGIGGEYDCTNIVRKTSVVGITSLGIDHTNLLGDTLEKIAWNKAGIMKKDSQVFTVPQPEDAFKVLEDRSVEKEVKQLSVIDDSLVNLIKASVNLPSDILAFNAALSVALSEAWCRETGKITEFENFALSPKTLKGLQNCVWPGRFQITQKENTTLYIDGAHTAESLTICASWFTKNTTNSPRRTALIFNATGDRNSTSLLSILHTCLFNKVIFVPNIANTDNGSQDNVNYNIPPDEQMKRCLNHKNIWLKLNKDQFGDCREGEVKVFPCVREGLKYLNMQNDYQVLVTGSLHLIGAVLCEIDPNLAKSQRKNVVQKVHQQVFVG